jgi:type IV pilus assembly protein PilW
MQSITYSVQRALDSGGNLRTDRHDNPVYSLFETPLGGNPVEIVNGVEDMQLVYGEDTGVDNFADVYVTAAGVTDWSRVVSVRISLLVGTAEDIGNEKRPYTDLQGNAVTDPGDFKIRRLFTSTVSLRNRST